MGFTLNYDMALSLGADLQQALRHVTNNILERKAKRIQRLDKQDEWNEYQLLAEDIEDITLCLGIMQLRKQLGRVLAQLTEAPHTEAIDNSRRGCQHASTSRALSPLTIFSQIVLFCDMYIPDRERLPELRSFLSRPVVQGLLGHCSPDPELVAKVRVLPTLTPVSRETSPVTPSPDLAQSVYHSVQDLRSETTGENVAQAGLSSTPASSPLRLAVEDGSLLEHARKRLSSASLTELTSTESRTGPSSDSTILQHQHIPSGSSQTQSESSRHATPSEEENPLLWSQGELNQEYLTPDLARLRKSRSQSHSGPLVTMGASKHHTRVRLGVSVNNLGSTRPAHPSMWSTAPEYSSEELDEADYETVGDDRGPTPLPVTLTAGFETDHQSPASLQLFATEVTVTDPIRVGFSLNSYIVYKCQAKRPDSLFTDVIQILKTYDGY
ncbi:hypothetical protein IWQ61_007182 [Dispira simplex]|nr:hypothetical protein IWQ61_007182 [Dispira simplex]